MGRIATRHQGPGKVLGRRWRARRPPTAWPDPVDCPEATFIDAELDSRFRREGYVVVDLVPQDAITDLLATCQRFHPREGPIWASDFFAADRDLKIEVFDAITSTLDEGASRVLRDHRPVIANFVISRPGAEGGIDLHHHSSLVDERRYRSVAIWLALHDTTEAHGTLHAVAGSHRVPRGPKGERGPEWFTDRVGDLMADHLRSVPLEAGQAIVFDNALLHGSFPNQTDEPRWSAVAMYVPSAAQPRYYEWRGDGRLDYYALEPEFFFDNLAGDHEWARPETLEHLGVEVADLTPRDEPDLDRLLLPGDCPHPI